MLRRWGKPAILLTMAMGLVACGGGGGETTGDGGKAGSGASVSVADTAVSEGDSGASNLSFLVSLSSAADGAVTVDYATSDGSATAGVDYAAASGTLTIPAGSQSASIDVNVLGDGDVESNETLTLTLSNASGATLARAQAEGTIENDDQPPVPVLSVTGASVSEGDSGSSDLIFTLSLNQAAVTDVTVAYATADGTAQAGSDYTATSGSLTIAAGDTSASVTVSVLGDTSVEADESFTLQLSNSSGASLGASSATGTILSDDAPAGIVVSVAGDSVTEGGYGSYPELIFSVSLNQASPVDVSVDYTTNDDTATHVATPISSIGYGPDYDRKSGTLIIPAGSLAATIAVRTYGDPYVESDESLFLTLSNPVNASLGTATAVGEIISDELPSLTVNSRSYDEGDNGSVNQVMSITISGPVSKPVSFDYASSDISATAGSDYTPISGTATIPALGTSVTVTVPIIGDTEVEGTETLSLNISNPLNATLATASNTLTIRDDDPKISIADAEMVEGDSGSSALLFTISLDQVSGSDITLNYHTVQQTATYNVDYQSVGGSVITIPAGSLSQTLPIQVYGDTVPEPDEMFGVRLDLSSSGKIVTNTAVGTIRNDDVPLIGVADATVVEGNSGTTSLDFSIRTDGAVSNDVSVDYSISDGSATAAAGDYTPTSGTLTIPAGSTAASISVPVAGDGEVEPDETLQLILSNPVNATLGATTATGTIQNDDPTLSVSDAVVDEGDSGTSSLVFTATLNTAIGSDITVDYASSDRTTTAGVDYTPVSGTLTIPAGSTTGSIAVSVIGDSDWEIDETLSLSLSNISSNAYLGRATIRGTIHNDDIGGLNDTGMTSSDASGDDASFGRDVTANDDSDGHAGFSFSKLDSSGTALADQAADYATAPWDCVRDNVTTLVWETKTDDSGTRDKDVAYSYATSSSYVDTVNAMNLCGYSDWRVPTLTELRTLLDFSNAFALRVDTNFFPHWGGVGSAAEYMSKTQSAVHNGLIWGLDFSDGTSSDYTTSYSLRLRLVRGGR